jgi:predicted acyltransferase
MMTAVFATLFLALVLGWLRRRTCAIVALAVCLMLSVWLFLFEIYSPDYGFRMPWIKTDIQRIPDAGA